MPNALCPPQSYFAEGEVIFQDVAALVGPWADHEVCLSCLTRTPDMGTCSKCLFRLCKDKLLCVQSHQTTLECRKLCQLSGLPQTLRPKAAFLLRMVELRRRGGPEWKAVESLKSDLRNLKESPRTFKVLATTLLLAEDDVKFLLGIRYSTIIHSSHCTSSIGMLVVAAPMADVHCG